MFYLTHQILVLLIFLLLLFLLILLQLLILLHLPPPLPPPPPPSSSSFSFPFSSSFSSFVFGNRGVLMYVFMLPFFFHYERALIFIIGLFEIIFILSLVE